MEIKAGPWTRVPNIIIDAAAREMSASEFKTFILLWRYTIGYRREWVKMSLRSMSRTLGCSVETIRASIKGLERGGYIKTLVRVQGSPGVLAIHLHRIENLYINIVTGVNSYDRKIRDETREHQLNMDFYRTEEGLKEAAQPPAEPITLEGEGDKTEPIDSIDYEEDPYWKDM